MYLSSFAGPQSTMDVDLANLLLTIGFVMLGSIVFHISTLISGYSIYREMQPVESAFLSTAAGLIIFLLSPIAFIVLRPSQGLDILDCILDFNIILSFFFCAIGLGMVFANLKILDTRVVLLTWIREKSGIPFWIFFHGVLWDDVLTTVKKGGEIFIETDESKSPSDSTGSKFRIVSNSGFDEKREMLLEEIDSGDRYLIPLEKMGFIRIPEKSLKKHEEKVNHIGQAAFCLLISIGVFLLAFSAKETYNFIQIHHTDIASILSFYWILEYVLTPCSIIMLVICVWTAKKDFDNWRSYYEICPHFGFLCLLLSSFYLLLMFPLEYQIVNAILFGFFIIFIAISIRLIHYENRLYKSKYLYYRSDVPIALFSFGIFFLYLAFMINGISLNSSSHNLYVIIGFILSLIAYIFIISKWIEKPVIDELQKIIEGVKNSVTYIDEDDLYGIMEKIVHEMYIEIYFNDLKKSNFSYLKGILKDNYSNYNEHIIVDSIFKYLKELEKRDYLKYEAGTILFKLQGLIKDKRKKLKDVYRPEWGDQNDSSA
jgi:hypothetical protein